VSEEKVEPLDRLVGSVQSVLQQIVEDITEEDAKTRAEQAVAAVLQSGYKITEPEAQLEFGFTPDEE
jgi:hypothetical protein